MKKTAKQNILSLPEFCYSVDLIDGKIIVIKNGENGYYLYSNHIMVEYQKEIINKTKEEREKFIDEINEKIGVSKAQRSAMEIGSMFGWGVPGVNIDNYNEDGSWDVLLGG